MPPTLARLRCCHQHGGLPSAAAPLRVWPPLLCPTAAAVRPLHPPQKNCRLSLSTWKESSSRVEEFARAQITPVTLAHLLELGEARDQLQSAALVHRELPKRLARRVRALQKLPFIVGVNPWIKKVYELYLDSFDTLSAFPAPIDDPSERAFAQTLSDLVASHQDVIPDLAKVLAEHHLALKDQVRGWIGIVNTRLFPATLVRSTAEFVQELCEVNYGSAPDFEIVGEQDTMMAYITVHLDYVLTELLKNANRATVEHSFRTGRKEHPKIEITIAKGAEDVTIRIRDQGGGISPEDAPRVFDYSFTTVPKTELEEDANNSIFSPQARMAMQTGIGGPIAGLGFGLPMSRIYARYFGGSLDLRSVSGHGLDVFLRLPSITPNILAVAENLRVRRPVTTNTTTAAMQALRRLRQSAAAGRPPPPPPPKNNTTAGGSVAIPRRSSSRRPHRLAHFSDRDVHALRQYKYSSIDRSFLANRVLNPYIWTPLARCMPRFVAPNVITLAGFLCVVVNVAALVYYSPSIDAPVPDWLYLSFALGMFAYQTLDAIDGKQARSTGMSGPLALVNFYVNTWEEYHTGTLFLSQFSGPIEGMFVLIAAMVVRFACGPDMFTRPLKDLVPLEVARFLGGKGVTVLEYPPSILVFASGILMIVLNGIGSSINVVKAVRARGKSIFTPFFGLLPVLGTSLGLTVWLAISPTIASVHLLPFILLATFLLGHQVFQIILAHVAKRPYPYISWPTLVVLAAGIAVSSAMHSWDPTLRFAALFAKNGALAPWAAAAAGTLPKGVLAAWTTYIWRNKWLADLLAPNSMLQQLAARRGGSAAPRGLHEQLRRALGTSTPPTLPRILAALPAVDFSFLLPRAPRAGELAAVATAARPVLLPDRPAALVVEGLAVWALLAAAIAAYVWLATDVIGDLCAVFGIRCLRVGRSAPTYVPAPAAAAAASSRKPQPQKPSRSVAAEAPVPAAPAPPAAASFFSSATAAATAPAANSAAAPAGVPSKLGLLNHHQRRNRSRNRSSSPAGDAAKSLPPPPAASQQPSTAGGSGGLFSFLDASAYSQRAAARRQAAAAAAAPGAKPKG
ncbi:hypothetical protein HK405_004400 [Cladochytrium tenue]|nr:hypothetical protein HK405_004400 [Cladochytrium tenue]